MTKTKIKKSNYCDTVCYNKHTKRKGIDGEKPCKECGFMMKYRNSLKVRSSGGSVRCGGVASSKTQFCSKECSLTYRNREDNPAQQPQAREKIRDSAKKRGVAHMKTPEAIKKRRESISGDKHWNWQGGKTSEGMRIRNSPEYKEWRTDVFERDDYTCMECSARSGNGVHVTLNADHIKPFSQFPESRLDVDNGRTLCLECHLETDTFGGGSHIPNKL